MFQQNIFRKFICPFVFQNATRKRKYLNELSVAKLLDESDDDDIDQLSASEDDYDDRDDVIQVEIVEVEGEDGERVVLTPRPVTPLPPDEDDERIVLTPPPPSPGSQDMFAPSPASPERDDNPPAKRQRPEPVQTVRHVQSDSSGTICLLGTGTYIRT